MAIIRDLSNSDSFQSYLATVALFCGISCTILMLKLRGFKASFNLTPGKRGSNEHYELAPQVSVTGAYRYSRDEYHGNTKYLDHRKIITPSMVKLPPTNDVSGNIKLSKSTGDLSNVRNDLDRDLRKSTPNVAVNAPTTAQSSKETKQQLKEQKKLEKRRLSEQKKREKLQAQERAKQEKLRKEREKQAAQQQAKEAKAKEKQRKMKPAAPPPKQFDANSQQIIIPKITVMVPPQSSSKQTRAPPPPQLKTSQIAQPNINPLSQRPQYSTNTLESSISRSSGPPPYIDTPEIVVNNNDNTGNTSFVKPVEVSSSWDLVSQHRQQIKRTNAAANTKPVPKQIDLQYNVGNIASENKDNSEV